ncbi:MAG: LysE family transporter [Saprospiraceae bacterium]|jgi:threonine/homoserine/homoserine lactone efflux protein|nr:LysE family transporter [Lewinellaceae bacterium]
MPVYKQLLFLLRSVGIGLGVSFAGSIGPSAINLTVMQVSVEAGAQQAGWFVLGMILTELVFIRASLGGLQKLLLHTNIRRALERLILILFVVLAAVSFYAAFQEVRQGSTFSPEASGNGFFLGILFRLLNPSMIPYWIGVNAGLMARELLPSAPAHFNVYAVGCALGTLAALGLYVSGGARLTAFFAGYRQWLDLGIGCFFLAAAAWMAFQNRIGQPVN